MPISANRPWWSREGRLFHNTDYDTPYPGRYNIVFPTGDSHWFGEVVFAYRPAARIWFEWSARRRFSVTVRLHRRNNQESIPPAVIDRVWQGIQRVRPAGVLLMLAVDNTIVRGG
jgi:hypothetical protein